MDLARSRIPACLAACALLAIPGCAEPFRVHVPAGALQQGIVWRTTEGPLESRGPFGPNSVWTHYVHQGSSPPFSADLLVFSERQGGGYSSDDLAAEARDLIRAASQDNMTLDANKQREGDRSLSNGLHTHWIMQEGRVTRQGTIFAQDATVRLVAEAGYDGVSSTAFVAVGQAQVHAELPCPIIGNCSSTTDTQSWRAIVGDPSGSIDGQRADDGLLYDLVTHE